MNFAQIKQSAAVYGCHVRATSKSVVLSSPDYSRTKTLTTQEANTTSAEAFVVIFEALSGRRITGHWTGGDAA